MPPARILCWSISAAMSLAGLVLATYLSVAYLSGASVACGVSGGCGEVTGSEYARFLGVPVALLGVGGYAALLMGSLAALGLGQPPATLRRALAGVACVGFAFSAYLTADAGAHHRLILRLLPHISVADDGDNGADRDGIHTKRRRLTRGTPNAH